MRIYICYCVSCLCVGFPMRFGSWVCRGGVGLPWWLGVGVGVHLILYLDLNVVLGLTVGLNMGAGFGVEFEFWV